MDGQAEMAPLSADDVAQFLIDNPEADGADDQQEQAPTDESPSDEDTDESETADDSPDAADDESDEQPDPTSGRKYKVTVKDDSGKKCSIRFKRALFGAVSYISLIDNDYIEVLYYKITKDEFRALTKAINDRENTIRGQKLNGIFKSESRASKLDQVI